jgi:hypothetical protein
LCKPIDSFAAVGRVTEQSGPMEILRNRVSQSSSVNSTLEMNDTVVTARARALLTFEDNTTVRVTEQSRLIIDDFVYDPRRGTGKLALKVALGTARYTSGQIAKNTPQQVAVNTPTATIAVRGTDFSMTVDELGRSLVVLLPSCDQYACVTGRVEVSNQAGSVILDQAYQATVVAAIDSRPSAPIKVTVEINNIDNNLILSPPTETLTDQQNSDMDETVVVNLLDQDFLKYDELERNELDAYNRLDRNFLNAELLSNRLDIENANIWNTDGLLNVKTLLPGYNAVSGLMYEINEDENRLTLWRLTSHIAEVIIPLTQGIQFDLKQDGVGIVQQVNDGGSTNIYIVQR